MGKIKFYSSGYWDFKTMGSNYEPSDENLKLVDDFCEMLTSKYTNESGCERHPETEQIVWVYFHNGVKSLNVSPSDTCRCYDMLKRLNDISITEENLHNSIS